MNLDDGILSLFELLDRVYAFLDDASVLNTMLSQQSIIARLAQQTVDCAYFIQGYSRAKNFCEMNHLSIVVV